MCIDDLYGLLIELDAYRRLSGQSFDFGTGMISDDSIISEDVYYKMQQQELEELLYDKINYIPRKKKKKNRLNKYERKKISLNVLALRHGRNWYRHPQSQSTS
jgi:hypothetical protein